MKPFERFLVVSNLFLLSLVGYFAITGFESKGVGDFKELNAERINVLGPSGKPVLVLANKETIPGPSLNGKNYARSISEGRDFFSGMIFFNDEGDEIGGLVFNSLKFPNGKVSAVGHLSFDQYKQNQTVALQNLQNVRGVKAGLTIWDRPTDVQLDSQLDVLQQMLTADSATKSELQKKLTAMHDRGEDGVNRVFVGSDNRVAMIQLRDTKGLVRARLVVDDKDKARLEFLDSEGKVTATFSPESRSEGRR